MVTYISLHEVPVNHDRSFRVDLVVDEFHEGRFLCLHVHITHSLTHRLRERSLVEAEQRKLTTYRGAYESIGMDFEPLVFDSFGGMGPSSLKTMQSIIARVTEKSCSPAEDSAYYWRRLSLILARAVCRQFIIAMN